jgi:two-component system cell cycle response regulator DivK
MARLLLVEDNELNRDMLCRRLQRRGHEVLLAADGQQGLDLALAERPALILLDMSLPGLDGWEAARRLKAAPETRATPILALTAHAMAGDRERALAAGCDDYDTKPVELPRLLAKIDALLARRVAPPVLRAPGVRLPRVPPAAGTRDPFQADEQAAAPALVGERDVGEVGHRVHAGRIPGAAGTDAPGAGAGARSPARPDTAG